MIRKVGFAEASLAGVCANVVLTTFQRITLGSPEVNSAISEFASSASVAEHVTFLLLIALIIPAGEELIFRGMLWRFAKRFMNEYYVAWAIAISFAFMHSFESAVFLFPFSVYLSHLRYTTESVRAGIVSHVAFNTTGVVFPSVMNWILT
jgi:membrane protease YdiL (CAAX protease family)